jgi:hypothetical protein
MAAKHNVWKPTADECKRIRDFTKREVRGLTRMEGGTRINLQDGTIEQSLNIALVAKTEDWQDTDLNDFISWAGFRAGVPLTEDGRAVIDFYCYSREGLETNIAVYYKDGAILKMGRTGSNRMINF